MSDAGVDERLLRVSVGVEDVEDLKNDFLQAFKKLVDGSKQGERKENGQTTVQVGQKGAKVEGAAQGSV